MTRSRLHTLLIVGAAALALSTAATGPVQAQFGGIVFDPTNYAQNILTAARELQ